MDSKNLSTHTFHVEGMHCQACVLVTESELKEDPRVNTATCSLARNSVTIAGDFSELAPTEIAEELTRLISKHGYALSMEKKSQTAEWQDFKTAIPLALGFIVLFVVLQKLGIVNLIGGSNVSYGTAFVIGVVASLSSCMAVVGGLVLSMSATFTSSGSSFRPQILFHIGRIVSFFILGGVIGAIGSAFALGVVGTFILSVLIGLIMLILGLNLLQVFPWTQRLLPSMPKFLSRKALAVSKLNHSLTPALIGLATFFLPCGFTQSMQIYALSTGNFLTAGLVMLSFALGTLPMLALVSFSSLSIRKGLKAGIFFKTAGLIVILFGLFNILNSLAAIGILPPLLHI